MRTSIRAAAVLLLMPLLRPGFAAAQSGSVPAPTLAMVHMLYTGTALGMDVMKLQAAVSMDGAGYRIATSFSTTGLL